MPRATQTRTVVGAHRHQADTGSTTLSRSFRCGFSRLRSRLHGLIPQAASTSRTGRHSPRPGPSNVDSISHLNHHIGAEAPIQEPSRSTLQGVPPHRDAHQHPIILPSNLAHPSLGSQLPGYAEEPESRPIVQQGALYAGAIDENWQGGLLRGLESDARLTQLPARTQAEADFERALMQLIFPESEPSEAMVPEQRHHMEPPQEQPVRADHPHWERALPEPIGRVQGLETHPPSDHTNQQHSREASLLEIQEAFRREEELQEREYLGRFSEERQIEALRRLVPDHTVRARTTPSSSTSSFSPVDSLLLIPHYLSSHNTRLPPHLIFFDMVDRYPVIADPRASERQQRELLERIPLMRYIPAPPDEDTLSTTVKEECSVKKWEDTWVKSDLPYLPLKDNFAVCPICLTDFDEPKRRDSIAGQGGEPEGETEPIRPLPCGHVYHKSCVDSWILGGSSTCPYCRKEIMPSFTSPRSASLFRLAHPPNWSFEVTDSDDD